MTLRLSPPTRVGIDSLEGLTFEARLALRDDDSLERWNGFVCPYFERVVVEQIAVLINSAIEEGDLDNTPLVWDHDTLTQDWPDGGGRDLWAPTQYGGLTLYCVGAWAWTWWLAEAVPA